MAASAIHPHQPSALRHPLIASPASAEHRSGAAPFASLLEEVGDHSAVVWQKAATTGKAASLKNIDVAGSEAAGRPHEAAEDTEAQRSLGFNEQDTSSPASEDPDESLSALPMPESIPSNSPKPARGANPPGGQRLTAKPASEIFTPVTVFTPLPLLAIPPLKEKQPANSGSNENGGVAVSADGTSQRRPAVDSAAVEIRIRAASDHAEDATQDTGEPPAQTASPRKPLLPAAEPAINPFAGKPQPIAPPVQSESNSISQTSNAHLITPADSALRQTAPAPAHEPDTPRARAAVLAEPLRNSDANQPLRAVSLEFSPDGAADIKLRLSERSGDVHVTLHSADPSLSGRLHAGVNDLIGSLSHAGYEAEAWTAGQGHRQHREPEERQSRRSGGDVPGGENFGGVLLQSES